MKSKTATFLALIGWLVGIASGIQAASLEVTIGTNGLGGFLIEKEVKSLHEIKRRNIVMQERDYSCGSAALATLFNYFLQDPVQEIEIINTLLEINKQKGTLEKVIQRKGFSLLDLKQYAENRKFRSIGYRLSFEDLLKLGVPAIVPIAPNGYKHFVVFRDADKGRVFLADPSIGNVTVSIAQFKKDWFGFTNVALVVLPQGEGELRDNPMSVSEMDQVFIEPADAGAIFDRAEPFLRVNPGEF